MILMDDWRASERCVNRPMKKRVRKPGTGRNETLDGAGKNDTAFRLKTCGLVDAPCGAARAEPTGSITGGL